MQPGPELPKRGGRTSIDPREVDRYHDAPTHERMTAHKEIRRNPSTDQRSQRRKIQRADDDRRKTGMVFHPEDGEEDVAYDVVDDNATVVEGPFATAQQAEQRIADLHAEGLQEGLRIAPRIAKERQMDDRQRESQIIRAMSKASLTEQQAMADELAKIRQRRSAAVRAERDLEWADTVVGEAMQPVAVATRHTAMTDWLDEVVGSAPTSVDADMRAQASLWFGRVDGEVKADRDEFAQQAIGVARRTAGQYGEQAEVAERAFLDHAGHLWRSSAKRHAQEGPAHGYAADEPVTREDFPRYNLDGQDLTPFDDEFWDETPASHPDSEEAGATSAEGRKRAAYGDVTIGDEATIEMLKRSFSGVVDGSLWGVWARREYGGGTGYYVDKRGPMGPATLATFIDRGSEGVFASVAHGVVADDGPFDSVEEAAQWALSQIAQGRYASKRKRASVPDWFWDMDPEEAERYLDVASEQGEGEIPDHKRPQSSRKQGYGGRSSYSGDPRWITTRRPGVCKKCHGEIRKDEDAFWWPKTKRIECSECGQESSARFEMEVADEDFMNRGFMGRRTAGFVELTNVRIDPQTGNGVGTDSSGNLVEFRLDDRDRGAGAAWGSDETAVNFSRVTVDQGDIISEGRRRTAKDPQSGHSETTLPHVEVTDEQALEEAFPWEIDEAEEVRRDDENYPTASRKQAYAVKEYGRANGYVTLKFSHVPDEQYLREILREDYGISRGARIESQDGYFYVDIPERRYTASRKQPLSSRERAKQAAITNMEHWTDREVQEHRDAMMNALLDAESSTGNVPLGYAKQFQEADAEVKRRQREKQAARRRVTKQATFPVNVGDWTDADWDMYEMQEAANDPDVPSCDRCGVKTYDLMPSLKSASDRICLGCAKREDQEMRFARRRAMTEGYDESSAGRDAADVAGTPTPGQQVADYPQPEGIDRDESQAWPGQQASAVIDRRKAMAFRERVQSNLRAQRRQ